MKLIIFIISTFLYLVLQCTSKNANTLYELEVKGPYASSYLYNIGLLDSSDIDNNESLERYLYILNINNLSKKSIAMYAMEKNVIYPKALYLNDSMHPSDFQDIGEEIPIQIMDKINIDPLDSTTFVFYLNMPNNTKFISIYFTIETSGVDHNFIKIEKKYLNKQGTLIEI